MARMEWWGPEVSKQVYITPQLFVPGHYIGNGQKQGQLFWETVISSDQTAFTKVCR